MAVGASKDFFCYYVNILLPMVKNTLLKSGTFCPSPLSIPYDYLDFLFSLIIEAIYFFA
jgi:hypothetical protein